MKVIIVETDMYRDGGTIRAALADGRTLYIDQRTESETHGQLFSEYPSHMKSEVIDDKPLADMIRAVHTALVDYKNARSEQRGSLTSLDAFEAHRGADLFQGCLGMKTPSYIVRYITPLPCQWCVDEPFQTKAEAKAIAAELREKGWAVNDPYLG